MSEPITYELRSAPPRKWNRTDATTDQIPIPKGHWMVMVTIMSEIPAVVDHYIQGRSWSRLAELRVQGAYQTGIFNVASDGTLALAVLSTRTLTAETGGEIGAVTLIPMAYEITT